MRNIKNIKSKRYRTKLYLWYYSFIKQKEIEDARSLWKTNEEKEKSKKDEEKVVAKKRKKAPKGYHYMPDGRLMKDSAHKGKRKKKWTDSPLQLLYQNLLINDLSKKEKSKELIACPIRLI